MAQSQSIFIDTSAFLAFIDRADINHTKSIKLFETLARQNFQIYTSNLVVFQTFSRLEKDLGVSLARDFLKTILEGNIHILHPGESDLISAYRFLKLNPERQTSLMEVVNTHLMDKSRVLTVLTFSYWHNLMGTSVSPLIHSL